MKKISLLYLFFILLNGTLINCKKDNFIEIQKSPAFNNENVSLRLSSESEKMDYLEKHLKNYSQWNLSIYH